MFLQFFTKRNYIIDKAVVLSIGKGVVKDPTTGHYSVGNRGVIELNDKFAKSFIKMYGKECEPWGKDAVIKKGPVKSKQANPRNTQRDLD